ncbi:MAG TPA: outer membrane protein assembly factor BamB [Halothiobacillus sp.]|nr:MAG: outer membrane protein assembly factor BamB [Halothiobacillus sp. 20-54-6]HQT42578.1 outer membrane protein assembly factor BamB [Halothiobacillus sp.]
MNSTPKKLAPPAHATPRHQGLSRQNGWRRVASLLLLPVALSFLAGCSETRELVKPTPLTQIDNRFPPKILWQASAGAGQKSDLLRIAPVESGGRVIVADARGQVFAYDLKSGKRLWETNLKANLSVGGGASDSMVVFGSDTGKVFALAADTGKPLWQAQVSTAVEAAPSVGNKEVVVRAKDGSVSLLKASDGSAAWAVNHAEPNMTLQGQSRALLFPDAVAIGYDDGEFAVLSRADGRPLWKNQIALPMGRTDIDRMVDIDATPLFADAMFYVVTYQGRLAAVSAQGGQTLWSRKFSGYTDMSLDAHALYVTDASGIVWALDRRTGEPLWRQAALAYRGVTGPALENNKLIVGDQEGYLHVLNTETGALVGRSRVSGGLIDPMRVEGDSVAATTRGGDLVVFQIP